MAAKGGPRIAKAKRSRSGVGTPSGMPSGTPGRATPKGSGLAPVFSPSPAIYPARRKGRQKDPRFLELFVDSAKTADVLLAGVPFDGAVIGRKGTAGGPTAIREAFRFLSTYDPETTTDLAALRIHDLGDVAVDNDQVLATHANVQAALQPTFRSRRPLILLGGDNSLSTPHVQALHQALAGAGLEKRDPDGEVHSTASPPAIGLIVLDAHYDLRPVPANGIPTSGTPYRRLIEAKTVDARRIVEIGIRPFANTRSLADYAKAQGVTVVTRAQLARQGAARVAKQALAVAGKGADAVFLSVDIDGLDQSIAPGVSAPGAGGMWFDEAAALVRAVASDPRCAGMDLVEMAPNLDPSGNTARTAAQLVAAFCSGLVARQRDAQ